MRIGFVRVRADDLAIFRDLAAFAVSRLAAAFSGTLADFVDVLPAIVFTSGLRSLRSRRKSQDFAFFAGLDLPERLRTTAWRTSALKADASNSSPSRMSIA